MVGGRTMADTVYQGRQGEYIILREDLGKLTVKYVSGKWKDKEVTMSKALHNKIQENIEIVQTVAIRQEVEDLNDKLDLWYQRYPALYSSLWKENIMGETLLEKLEEEYPDAASNINMEV